MPSLKSWLLQSTLVTSGAGLATFVVFTKHVKMHDLDIPTDPLIRDRFYNKFNPGGTGTSNAVVVKGIGKDKDRNKRDLMICDVAVRKIPVWQVKKDLIEDAERGGTKLIEAFTGAVWGGFGYLPQRKILEFKHRNTPAGANQLWDKQEILESTYDEGTNVTNHFNVLRKTPTAILFRGGDSPLTNPDAPRPTDGLIEITATPDMTKGFVKFTLKSVFFAPDRPALQQQQRQEEEDSASESKVVRVASVLKEGESGNENGKQNGGDVLARIGLGTVVFLHQQYTKLMVESAVRKVLA